MSRPIEEIKHDIKCLTTVPSAFIFAKLDELAEEVEEIYQQGRAEAIEEYKNKLDKEMHDLWEFYKADTKNRPKPTFLCANSMIDLIAEQLKEQEHDVL